MKVTILSKELIVPFSPTHSNLKTYKLSYIDQQIPPYYIPLILYYSYDESTNITQSQMIIKLKTSLSKILTHFYPLAGRLSKDRNTIDCNDQGIQFSVAQVESNFLDFIGSPMINELNQLVKVESYVEEQLAIQVNLFDCGSIAIGVSLSHRIADACSFSSFVSHWLAMAKDSNAMLVGPVLDSAVLFPPMKEPFVFVRNPKDPTVYTRSNNLVTKRFVFGSESINKLKLEAVKSDTTLVDPTRVEVVTALIWKCGTAALGDCKSSVAFHVVDFRKKMVPTLHDHHFGNLFQLATAITSRDQIDGDMASLVMKLRGAFGKIDNEYLSSLMGENGVEIAKRNFKDTRKFMIQEGVGVFRFSSWCRLAVNEADFGWGKPIWVSSANFSDENCIILMDSRTDGGIEAWVVMNEDYMLKFEQNIELKAFVGSAAS